MTYPYQNPAPRKRHTVLWILLAVALVIIAGFAACTISVGHAVSRATAPRTLTYELEGDGVATVSYTSAGGGLAQYAGTKLPFATDVSVSGFSISILIATLDQRGGNVTCRIVDNSSGKTLSETKSSGAFMSCSTSATLTGSTPPGSSPQT